MRHVHTLVARTAAALSMLGVAAAAAAHPGHAAPDIVHGIEALAAAPAGHGGLGGVALWLVMLGAVLLAAGPVADAAGKALPGGVRRLARPLGLAALGLAALAAVGPF